MKKQNDIFKAKILWENLNESVVDVAVPSIECFKATLFRVKNKDIPMWILRQQIVEKYFKIKQDLSGCQGGIVLHLVDEDDKLICVD